MSELATYPAAEQAERHRTPRVEPLVWSDVPERRAFTIDNITTPDFDAVDPEQMAQTIHYIMTPDQASPIGYSFEARTSPTGPQEPANMDTYKAWMAEAINATDDIPKGGQYGIFMDLSYLAGPLPVGVGTGWHRDGDLGAFTIFENDPTWILKKRLQDKFASNNTIDLPKDRAGLTDQIVVSDTGEKTVIKSYIARPDENQTVYIGPEAWHTGAVLPAGTSRRGVICFIYARAEPPVGDGRI